MSTSKLDTSKTPISQPAKKEKNIREIYLQALNHSKTFQKSIKKPGLSNLAEDRNINNGSSQFLEKEYNIVQRIISDTKELKNIKVRDNSKDGTKKEKQMRYKDPEEYYKEILELKKTLKIYEENEVINRTKFEYYENELVKKEQEIMDLLDIKKTEQFRTSDSKADLATLIYGLKQKIFKLEFSLKRKESEFNKLKTEIKTTNMKELKIQNERLRLELSKALTNDRQIIEELENKSNFELYRIQNESQLSFKKDLDKKNVAVSGKADSVKSSPISESLNFESKIVLSGSLRDKINQLNQRETELIFEISRLNKELDKYKSKKGKNSDSEAESVLNSTRGSNRSSRQSKRSPNIYSEKEKLNSKKMLQSVIRGHLERSNSLKRAEREKMDRRRSQSRSPSWRTPSPRRPRRYSDKRRSLSPEYERQEPRYIVSESESDQENRSDTRKLINDEKVSETESEGFCKGLCGSWKSKK